MIINGVSLKTASTLLRRDNRSHLENAIMDLCKQNLLATAEIIKCVESDIKDISTDDKLMDVLFDDESTTSDNLIFSMLNNMLNHFTAMKISIIFQLFSLVSSGF